MQLSRPAVPNYAFLQCSGPNGKRIIYYALDSNATVRLCIFISHQSTDEGSNDQDRIASRNRGPNKKNKGTLDGSKADSADKEAHSCAKPKHQGQAHLTSCTAGKESLTMSLAIASNRLEEYDLLQDILQWP